MPARIASTSKEKLECEAAVGRAIESAAHAQQRGCREVATGRYRRNIGRRNHREILTQVRSRISIFRIIRCDAVISKIDPKTGVRKDRVVKNTYAKCREFPAARRCFGDAHSLPSIEADQIVPHFVAECAYVNANA